MLNSRLAHNATRQHATMTRRGKRSRPITSILLLLVATIASLWGGSTKTCIQTIAFSRNSRAKSAPNPAVPQEARLQYHPQHARLSHRGFQLESTSRGKNEWEVIFGEDGQSDAASAVVSKLADEPISYGVIYDSTKSKFRLPETYGIKRVALSAANHKSDPQNFNMNLDVEGDGARHFSFTKDNESFVYDASLGVEVPLPLGVNGVYAVDAKRRLTGRSILPNWLRQSLGLQYRSKSMGDAKIIIHQKDPDLDVPGLDYEAVYQGKLKQIPGSPTYFLRAAQERDMPVAYNAKLGLTGPKGIKGGVDIALANNKTPSISGYGLLSASGAVVPGITVDADTKVKAASNGKSGVLVLDPINMKATAELATLVPELADEGSEVVVNAKYKPGAVRPALQAAATFNSQPIGPVRLAAAGEINDRGNAAGRFRVGNVGGYAQYEARRGDQGLEHIGEVVVPAKLQEGRSQVYGRIMQSRHEHDGQPRLQLGLRYDVDVGDSAVRLEGENIAFDNGYDLAYTKPSTLQKAHNDAVALRKQVETPFGSGQQWVRR